MTVDRLKETDPSDEIIGWFRSMETMMRAGE